MVRSKNTAKISENGQLWETYPSTNSMAYKFALGAESEFEKNYTLYFLMRFFFVFFLIFLEWPRIFKKNKKKWIQIPENLAFFLTLDWTKVHYKSEFQIVSQGPILQLKLHGPLLWIQYPYVRFELWTRKNYGYFKKISKNFEMLLNFLLQYF